MSPSQTAVSNSEIETQRAVLLEACSQCVRQCLEVVQALPQDLYQQPLSPGSSIGTHVRHIIERITCVLGGLADGSVDYDLRPRDRRLENSPGQAGRALQAIQTSLSSIQPDAADSVKVVESVHQDSPSVAVASSLNRELMSLVSHTIHHLAIIALLARSAGFQLPPEVGKAPSTIRHERSLA